MLNLILRSTIHQLTNVKCSLLTETNTNHIKRAINESPLDRSLANLDTNNKVYLCNEKINILSNLFPHETITLDDIDPTWINSKVKHLVNGINESLTNIALFLARDNLPGLVSNLTSNAINKFEGKISGKGAVRVRKDYILSLFRMKI